MHLYAYLPAVWLQNATELAVPLIKLAHAFAQSIIFCLLTDVTFKYWPEASATVKGAYDASLSSKGQLLAFAFISSHLDRHWVTSLFNDHLMALAIVLTLHSLASDRLFLALFSFSVAYGLKAGAVLLIPALLGIIQYNYGTIKLIMSIVFLVAFQAVIALPFVLSAEPDNRTDAADYLTRSKLLGASGAGILGRPATTGYLASGYGQTIFWQFVSDEVYADKARLADRLMIGQLVANTWFFFVRKNCFPQCLTNLFATLGCSEGKTDGVKSLSQLRTTVDVLVVQWMAGTVLMPGAHGQFQHWYVTLVPLYLSMVGLPALATFWIPLCLYPCYDGRIYDASVQHILLLAVTVYLLIIGPGHKNEESKKSVAVTDAKKNN